MRKKLAMLAIVLGATAAAILSTPYKAEAACNKTCCNFRDCSCCTSGCPCPVPGLTAVH
jgi:hypothetical protein